MLNGSGCEIFSSGCRERVGLRKKSFESMYSMVNFDRICVYRAYRVSPCTISKGHCALNGSKKAFGIVFE